LTNNNPYEDNDFKGSWTAGVGLNWMIFDWGKSKQEILKTDARIEQLRVGQDALKVQAQSEIRAVHRSLNESIDGLKIAREAVDNAKRALEIAELQYKEGMITDIVLTESRKALTEAQAQIIQSRIQIELATVSFKLALGAD
jgi:outer membrane protein TolC